MSREQHGPEWDFFLKVDDRPTGEKSANARDDQDAQLDPSDFALSRGAQHARIQQNNGGRKCQEQGAGRDGMAFVGGAHRAVVLRVMASR